MAYEFSSNFSLPVLGLYINGVIYMFSLCVCLSLSYIPNWPQILYIGENDDKPLILLPPSPECRDYRHGSPCLANMTLGSHPGLHACSGTLSTEPQPSPYVLSCDSFPSCLDLFVSIAASVYSFTLLGNVPLWMAPQCMIRGL